MFIQIMNQFLGFLSRTISCFVYKCVLFPAAAQIASLAQFGGRSRSISSSPRKHAKRNSAPRTYKEILFWLAAFLLLLAFFRVRPPENDIGSELIQ